MMPFISSLLLAVALSPQDTTRLTPSDALARMLERSPTVRAADARAEAGRRSALQSEAWMNPLVSVVAENLGAMEETTGIPGWEGVEGQALLTVPLPVSGIRGARAEQGHAAARVLEASAEVTRADLTLALAIAAAREERDRRLFELAREEATSMAELARILGLQAEQGRTSEGEAARAHLAAVVAATLQAQMEAEWIQTRVELARLTGFDPARDLVRVEVSGCVASAGEAGSPDLALAEAASQQAAAGENVASKARFPDLLPQIGPRRMGGYTTLYLGLALELPLFNARGEGLQAARSEALAAQEDLELTRQRLAAQAASARARLDVMERAGTQFTPQWQASLHRSRDAAQVRYAAGEGTLVELLDGRRARLQAVSDYERWRAGYRVAWAEVVRLSDNPVDPLSLCLQPPAEFVP